MICDEPESSWHPLSNERRRSNFAIIEWFGLWMHHRSSRPTCNRKLVPNNAKRTSSTDWWSTMLNKRILSATSPLLSDDLNKNPAIRIRILHQWTMWSQQSASRGVLRKPGRFQKMKWHSCPLFASDGRSEFVACQAANWIRKYELREERLLHHIKHNECHRVTIR